MRCASRSTEDQTISSCCSEDESNSSHELRGGSSSSLSQNDSTALKLSGKSRSSRGPATDPQSLYARVSPFGKKNNLIKLSLLASVYNI
jgi:hypothetical protein